MLNSDTKNEEFERQMQRIEHFLAELSLDRKRRIEQTSIENIQRLTNLTVALEDQKDDLASEQNAMLDEEEMVGLIEHFSVIYYIDILKFEFPLFLRNRTEMEQ